MRNLRAIAMGITDAMLPLRVRRALFLQNTSTLMLDNMYNQMSDCPYSPALLRSFHCIEQCEKIKQMLTWICLTFKAYTIF